MKNTNSRLQLDKRDQIAIACSLADRCEPESSFTANIHNVTAADFHWFVANYDVKVKAEQIDSINPYWTATYTPTHMAFSGVTIYHQL